MSTVQTRGPDWVGNAPDIVLPAAGKAVRRRPSLFDVVSIGVVAALAFLALYPLARIAIRLFFTGEGGGAAALAVYGQPGTWVVISNTVIVVAASGVLSLAIGSALAWINERTDARIGVLTDIVPLLPFLVPPIAGAIGWVLLLSDRAGFVNAVLRWALGLFGVEMTRGPLNIYTWGGLIFVYTVYAVPYVYLVVSAGLRNVDSALEEQSRICGNGLLRTMAKVTIPAVRPALGGAALLIVWFGFSLFSVPAIIGTGAKIEVLPVRLVRLVTFTYPPDMAGAIGLGLVVLLAVGTAWMLQLKVLSKGRFATVSGKGSRTVTIELGAWRPVARSVIVLYMLISAVLPLVALLLVALNGFWTPTIRWTALNFNTFREILFEDGLTLTALRNSLSLGIAGATIGIVAAAVLSLFVQRHGSAAARAVDGLIKLPASVSSIVLALGFVLAFSGAPFNLNGTFLILLMAYLALYMPQASVAADSAAAQVGRELTEASRICGASGGRTFMRVSLPLMLGGLAAGWALLFVRMISDLTASSILAGTQNPVVGFRILEIYEGASFAGLAALSSLLTVISCLVVGLVLVFSRRRGRGAPRSAS
ncbi:ABC transporter permease [Chelatococcus asaccharovorans]|uniref:ABC transporter permease n=1 Tax=Chelatococcus asaccharovorans TaxID=28210 RepID=UPI002263B542|nr:iron ABC transporter permease [Chelatococcus asaccharovorans]